MGYISIGLAGFLLIFLTDFGSIIKISLVKPLLWSFGILALGFSIVQIIHTSSRIALTQWLTVPGWILLVLSLVSILYILFINLPFRNTYLNSKTEQLLVTTGLYGLVRHPGLYPFVGTMTGLVMVFPSYNMFMAAIIFTGADLALIVFQDRIVFPRMFNDYSEYKKEVPMIFPDIRVLAKKLGSFKENEKTDKKNYRRNLLLSSNVELFKKGRHAELWQKCCGFIDLSIEEFSQIQKRLLLEQIELLKQCELGQKILNGARPETVEEFRSTVPLTTYADYASHLLRRRKEGLPRRPILWQCTSGKSGESTFRWVPVTARQLEEIEPLIFALIFFSSCRQRGEIRFKEGDNVFYGMAPPPYATGTMTRVLPHEIFNFLPPVELSEQVSFEERTKLGFKMALEEGLDLCFAMSSVAVAIGKRFGESGNSSSFRIRDLIRKPGMAARMLRGLAISKTKGRRILPRDIFKLKGMITFGLDGVIYRDKIKEMWGRYPLDFHGCTEAVVIATQTWDYEGMTFIPNLNFFEFITEEDSQESYQDAGFVPKTYLIDELKPGNYELVITSFHGGPFVRYRLGHLVKIHSVRNEKLSIDIPQMSFIGRVDDQIDIAGFTRLSEKVIWQAIEKSGVSYAGWTARKEIDDKPVLNIYIETKDQVDQGAGEIAARVHKELKKIDVPYSELESFTGLNPLAVTLLPRGAFTAYKQYQLDNGADISQLKPPHLNPTDETIRILKNPDRSSILSAASIQV